MPSPQHKRKRKQKKSRTKSEISTFSLVWAMVFGLLISLYEFMSKLWSSPTFKISFISLASLIIFIYFFKSIKKLNKTRRQLLAIHQVKISDNRFDYFIEATDYKRGNPKENLYRKLFHLTLLEIFENRCGKCGNNANGIDIDHFFLSKNDGGCFIMRHKSGYLVNNAIPLCQTCNRRKSDKNYRDFFSREEILFLLQKSSLLTKKLNKVAILNPDGSIMTISS